MLTTHNTSPSNETGHILKQADMAESFAALAYCHLEQLDAISTTLLGELINNRLANSHQETHALHLTRLATYITQATLAERHKRISAQGNHATLSPEQLYSNLETDLESLAQIFEAVRACFTPENETTTAWIADLALKESNNALSDLRTFATAKAGRLDPFMFNSTSATAHAVMHYSDWC